MEVPQESDGPFPFMKYHMEAREERDCVSYASFHECGSAGAETLMLGMDALQEHQSTDTRKCRPQLFYTCAVAILTFAHKTYAKAEQLHGPIGSLARRMASHVGPIFYPILYHWLEILLSIDNQLIALENTTEAIFPPSALVFKKLDSFIHGFENLPRKFDDVVAHFSMMVHQSPTLNLAITYLSIGIDFFVSTVGDWTFYGMKEKEIAVDVNYNEPMNETSVEDETRHSEGAECIEKQNTIEKSTIVDDKPHSEGKVMKKKKKKRQPRTCDIEDMKQVESACTKILEALEKTPMGDEIGGEISKACSHDDKLDQETKCQEKPMVGTPEVPTQVNACGSELKVKRSQNKIFQLFHTGWHAN